MLNNDSAARTLFTSSIAPWEKETQQCHSSKAQLCSPSSASSSISTRYYSPPREWSVPAKHTHKHTRTHKHTHTNTHKHTHTNTHRHTHTDTHTHTQTHTRTHTDIHTHTLTHTQTYTHTNTHRHTQAHTHTQCMHSLMT